MGEMKGEAANWELLKSGFLSGVSRLLPVAGVLASDASISSEIVSVIQPVCPHNKLFVSRHITAINCHLSLTCSNGHITDCGISPQASNCTYSKWQRHAYLYEESSCCRGWTWEDGVVSYPECWTQPGYHGDQVRGYCADLLHYLVGLGSGNWRTLRVNTQLI